MVRLLGAALLSAVLLPLCCKGFYLPGVAPQDYAKVSSARVHTSGKLTEFSDYNSRLRSRETACFSKSTSSARQRHSCPTSTTPFHTAGPRKLSAAPRTSGRCCGETASRIRHMRYAAHSNVISILHYLVLFWRPQACAMCRLKSE